MYSNVPRDSEYISRLLDFIRREYRLNPTDIVPAERGYYGETWRLGTSEDRYFLKLDYSAAHKFIYRRSFPVIEHLCHHGVGFISKIVKTAERKLCAWFDEAVAGVFEWIDGENVKDERARIAEYQMLAKIYAVPAAGLILPRAEFGTGSASLFFSQWDRLKLDSTNETTKGILELFDANRFKLEHRAKRLELFAWRCEFDTSHFYITHGDAGGNMIAQGNSFFIVDWDDPMLAPPERDAWFYFSRSWAMDAFNKALRQNKIDYSLRLERLAYFGYHSFFWYLTKYLETYFDIGNQGAGVAGKLTEYFSGWIEDVIQHADSIK
jgi:hypothetical protein